MSCELAHNQAPDLVRRLHACRHSSYISDHRLFPEPPVDLRHTAPSRPLPKGRPELDSFKELQERVRENERILIVVIASRACASPHSNEIPPCGCLYADVLRGSHVLHCAVLTSLMTS